MFAFFSEIFRITAKDRLEHFIILRDEQIVF